MPQAKKVKKEKKSVKKVVKKKVEIPGSVSRALLSLKKGLESLHIWKVEADASIDTCTVRVDRVTDFLEHEVISGLEESKLLEKDILTTLSRQSALEESIKRIASNHGNVVRDFRMVRNDVSIVEEDVDALKEKFQVVVRHEKKTREDLEIMQTGWKLQANAIEHIEKSVDSFENNLVSVSGKQERFEVETRGRMIMMERKIAVERMDKREIERKIKGFGFEMWYWTMLASIALGLAFGLLAVVSEKILQ